MKRRVLWAVAVLATLVLAGLLLWWTRLPRLVVYVQESSPGLLDRTHYRTVFREAGVWRLKLRDGEPAKLGWDSQSRTLAIELRLVDEANPKVDQSSRELGLTGPGFTEGRVSTVYLVDVKAFVVKHREDYLHLEATDWSAVERRLVANTAVHESWHAIALSASHNPTDKQAVMYIDPGRAAVEFGTTRMLFTRGHERRLREIFREGRADG